ncbi:MAG: LuxR C-terminal-related transcriptional regulator [Desulfovibrionaceae bacterium]
MHDSNIPDNLLPVTDADSDERIEETSQTPRIQDLSQVLDAMSDHVLYAGDNGIVLDANAKAGRFYGREHLLGRSYWDVLGLDAANLKQALERYPPDQVQEISSALGQGSYCLRIVQLPAGAAPGGFVVLATDNKPLAQAHAAYEERLDENITALDNSIRLFNALFDTAKDAMLLLDSKRRVRAANPKACQLLDPDRAGLTAKDARSVLLPADHADFDQAMDSLGDGQSWITRNGGLDLRGKRLSVETILRRIDLEELVLYQLVLRDLTTQVLLEQGLRNKRAEVEGMNLALRSVVRSAEEEKREMRRAAVNDIRDELLPTLDRMAREPSASMRATYRDLAERRLHELSEGRPDTLSPLLLKLTPREIDVCRLIRLGRSGQEIAEQLNISFETIQTHRKNIRRKLGLTGRRASLTTFLQQTSIGRPIG